MNFFNKGLSKVILIAIILVFSANMSYSQKWQRSSAPVEPDLMLFHSRYALNLPTAETMKQGDFHFGITHRFNTPVKTGWSELFGLDGGVTMRIELGYAITDKLLAMFGRSNREGNLDLQFKYKTFQFDNDLLPTLVSFNAGVAYTGKPVEEPANDSRQWQYFGQAIINTMFMKKIAIGVVPTYLYNSEIICSCDDNQYSFVMGTYAQYYINDMWSVLLEYSPTVMGWRDQYDSFAFGIEAETGGHFFKVLLGNNVLQNMTQYNAGASSPIRFDDMHIGFNITRTL